MTILIITKELIGVKGVIYLALEGKYGEKESRTSTGGDLA